MARIALEGKRWFDDRSGWQFCESTYWDGNNEISHATGSQWEHETLYYTQSGSWIINHWSQWQGVCETYVEVDQDRAVEWLVQTGHADDLHKLPDDVRTALEESIEAAEA